MTAGVRPATERETAALIATAARASVFVVGTLNMDLIVQAPSEPADDGAVVAESIVTAPGGHAGNCAAALAALGLRVGVSAAIGVDADGDQLLADLSSRGIAINAVHRYVGAPTGRVIIPVFPDKHYMLMHRGANSLLSPAQARDALNAPVDAVVMFDPGPEVVREVVDTLAQRRPRPLLCWCPGGLYAGDPLAREIAPYCDILMLNRDERYRLETEAGWVAQSPDQQVVTTLGAHGASVRQGGREWSAPAFPTALVDPTGAGDSFTAGYLLATLAGLDPAARVRVGNAAGALAVGAVGARASVATLPELLDRFTGAAHETTERMNLR
ncbi:carbohydrate kinase family protein [Actinoplanes teichomyceticus]|uniref:Ribokinase n=1 Tax=Actinoplanes teichomyceticus TaxID=1867 RepID=A0A561VIN6_ACTTI|nr:PfkB family carbohydrate kinase [Actinoplanes teichomyceticus]TWG11472.1 ribokinase [Actinoplanes teichomyceticus]GIF15714.1 ribokinase [Actinoplanes teichomyceticus]